MGMIYNPWHGCTKISEGCTHCYMYFLDKQYDRGSIKVTKNKSTFNLPIKKDRAGQYKIRPGQHVMVCMTSDFFHEEADPWRDEVWAMLKFRSDVIWTLLTKRAENITARLPQDWGNGYENVRLGVTAENQNRADQRIEILLNIPAKHRWINCAPLIGPINIERYLESKQIEQVQAGGENYDGARPCEYAWVKSLHDQCYRTGVEFNLYETGTNFVLPNGKVIYEPRRNTQSRNAAMLGTYLSPQAQPVYKLFYPGTNTPVTNVETPKFDNPRCQACGNRPTCGGCTHCGKCERKR